MDAVEFLKQLERFCDHHSDCESCGFESNIVCANIREDVVTHNPQQLVATIEKWAKEHPQKTYLMDFAEKYPHHRTIASGAPATCRENLYPTTDGFNMCIRPDHDCKTCWYELMPD